MVYERTTPVICLTLVQILLVQGLLSSIVISALQYSICAQAECIQGDISPFLLHICKWDCFVLIAFIACLQIAYDPGNKSKPIAIRIRKLPKGSIRQEQIISIITYTGTVTQDHPTGPKAKKGTPNSTNSETGLIQYTTGNKEQCTIVYQVRAVFVCIFKEL